MNSIRSSLGPPWYLCNVRIFVVRDSAGVSRGVGGLSWSFSGLDFLHFDHKSRLLFRFWSSVRFSLSESEASDSETELECRWKSFCRGRTTEGLCQSECSPSGDGRRYCTYDLGTSPLLSCSLGSSSPQSQAYVSLSHFQAA